MAHLFRKKLVFHSLVEFVDSTDRIVSLINSLSSVVNILPLLGCVRLNICDYVVIIRKGYRAVYIVEYWKCES